ncbi:MAG: molybdenum cofactor biosynthesis protein MoaE [Myxococcota bacterium]
MALVVRYHAAARELAGCREETLALDAEVDEAGLCAALAAQHPALGPFLARMRFAKNGDFAPRDARYASGDEVDVMPPVAGGAPDESPVRLADVRDAPLSMDECYRAVAHAGAGGVCVFTGVVRDHADGKEVSALDYEAMTELAITETERVLAKVAEEVPGTRLAAVHRVGALQIGDLAVVVAASAAHRAEAFQACRLAIDRIKETVPIWKKEYGVSGDASWVNLEG